MPCLGARYIPRFLASVLNGKSIIALGACNKHGGENRTQFQYSSDTIIKLIGTALINLNDNSNERVRADAVAVAAITGVAPELTIY